jgi:bifunctional non-homologous end joining protein LigD
VEIYSRNLLSFKEQFPEVTEALTRLGIQAVFDGEICVVDEEGRAQFQLIQNYRREGKGTVGYYIFDILYYQGYDLKNVSLIERKFFLKKLLPENDSILKYSDHVEGNGKEFFQVAKKQGLEGIVAKRSKSIYQEGVRGRDWLKIKILCEQEAVVAGYTAPRGGRKNFGALVLGVYDGDELIYIGHSGGGFTEKNLKETFSKLKNLQTEICPFRTKPKTNMPVTWVKPELVCMVKFQEWTKEGLMRQPIFLGFRNDKDAHEVKREFEKSAKTIIKNEKKQRSTKTKIKDKTTTAKVETKNEKAGGKRTGRRSSEVKNREAVSLRGKTASPISSVSGNGHFLKSDNYTDEHQNEGQLKISGQLLTFINLKKVFWPEEGFTKEDLLEYYHNISSFLLPYVKDRPENLRRNPHGYTGHSFFQKDMPKTIPDWLETVKLYSESVKKNINYLLCQDEAALLYMVNLGCIEINPWLSRVQSLDYPDYIVMDLDPHDVPFEQVIEVTHAVKEVLDKGKVEGFCKTSGSRGMHIYIPMDAKYDYDQAKNFAHLIASLTHELVPEITSLERMPSNRRNKIYLDYLQNRKGQTLAAPYCVRPKPGATVSTPLEWSEIKKGLHPSQFTIKTIFERLKEKGDLFKGVMKKGVDVEKALDLLKG